ncbi:DNA-processing protein DprA, partial [Psychrobacter sp. TB20-MNA-CIBAN-0197]
GIEVYYPNHHDKLFAQIIEQGGCIISELLPDTPPHKHTFPRRNRLVAGLSLATIVTEATIQSGSLITARLTSEQGKQVFAIPSHIDNSNAEGCHHLIR